MEYKFLCIGDFNVERDDATASETRSEVSLSVSLVIHRVDGGMYERVCILEHTGGRQVTPMYELHMTDVLTSYTHV
jgi:hypothetical protein